MGDAVFHVDIPVAEPEADESAVAFEGGTERRDVIGHLEECRVGEEDVAGSFLWRLGGTDGRQRVEFVECGDATSFDL